MSSSPASERRPALTRAVVLAGAVALADREGLAALTMRRLGAELGVEAMSLYAHVANKGQILDGIVELIATEIDTASAASEPADWHQALRGRATAARGVLSRHPWAIGLLESRRTMGPATMASLEGMLGRLRAAGFSLRDAAYALWVLDGFVYGHVVQAVSVQAATPTQRPAGAAADAPGQAGSHPNLTELQQLAGASTFSLDEAFTNGLDLILEALARSAVVHSEA